MFFFASILLLALSVSAKPQEYMPYAYGPASNSYDPANNEYAPVEPAVSAENRQDSQSVDVGEWYRVAEDYEPKNPNG